MSGCRSKQEENPYIDGPINILAAHTIIGFPQYYHLPFARPYLVCFDLINNPISSQTQKYLQTYQHRQSPSLEPLHFYVPIYKNSPMNKWEISFIASVCTIVLLCSYYSILKSACLAFRGATSRNRDRRRLMNEADPESDDLSLQFHSHGLESSILNSIPITQFEKKNEGEDTERNTECAVCLDRIYMMSISIMNLLFLCTQCWKL
ncbi:hypothetical protein F2P56_032602 [Juglans regia]|uniref:RING-type E3 ubiquitin transferase n=1 Tax=Juglans regia TaxID=51240 RepID=A0A833TYT5_JUGRE|nr:hypothetical protein F2P56_032602 [Juglans regia]